MRYLLLTFDLEEFDLPEEYGINISDLNKFGVSFEGAKKIVDLLEKTDTKATFFVTASFAKRYPKLVRGLSEKNEVALHAYEHSQDYEKMDSISSKRFLSLGREILQKIIKKEVIGFRAPRMKKPNNSVLEGIGIKYDSSLHPTYVPRRYNNLFKRRKPHLEGNILEIPISVTPLLRMPFSFLWFRLFGLTYAKICTKLSLIGSDYVNIYFHPWEFINLKELEYSDRMSKLIIRNTGQKIEKNLEKYILWCKKKQIISITVKEYYEMLKNKMYLA